MKKKEWIYLGLLLLLFIYYFVIPMNIFWDTGHYMSYVSILEGNMPWSSWDIVRGIIFPLILYLNNLFFGKTTQGVLILSFIFYLSMLIIVKTVLDKLLEKESKKVKRNINIGLFTFIILDPIIYGYYHALLTEFIAMTISLLMCYLSWKWISIKFDTNKKKYIIYSIAFIMMTILSWHLKQPYVTISIFPIIISAIISCISNRKISNILPRMITTFSCIIGLVISIVVWNQFLVNKGIDLNTDRNVTASFGNQLLTGLNNYEVIATVNSENINDNKYLTQEEKELLKTNSKKYNLINIKNLHHQVIDQAIIPLNDKNNISTFNSILFIGNQMFQHPLLVLESYTSNYLAIANLYPKKTNDSVAYWIEKDLTLDYCHENCSIAVSVATKKSNLSYMPEESLNRVIDYEQYNNSPVFLRYLLKAISWITTNLYKVLIVILPILVIVSTISLIKQKQKQYLKLLEMIVILSGYSLLHILVHVATGACIDRYAAPAYIPIILSLCLYGYYVIKIKNKKSSGKYERTEK